MQELIFLNYFRVLVKISFNFEGLNDLYGWFANSEVLKYLFFRERYVCQKNLDFMLSNCYLLQLNLENYGVLDGAYIVS